jgi:ABC-type branched-subunit amino acid transport system permease subunit
MPTVIHDLLPFFVTGLATGSVYAIAAMGLVLTYKTSGVFNFAHGAVAAAGAYVMWDLWSRHGWPWPLAILASLLLVGVVGGLLLERMAYGLRDKPTAMRVVASVGLLIAVQGLLVVRYGTATIPMKYFLPSSTVSILGVNVRYEQIIVFLLAIGAAVALTAFFRNSRQGVAMQGVVDDPALLGLLGTSPIAVRRSAWIIGCCFAAASGALLAPTLGLDATLLTLLVVQAFGAAAIGRFSSLPLTYAGGLAVGVGQEVLKYVVARPAVVNHISAQVIQPLPSNLPFIVLFIVLLLAPKGKLFERGVQVVRRQRSAPPISARQLVPMTMVAGFGLLVVPHVVGTRLPAYTAALAFSILFSSLYLLVRTSGQVSLCHMAFAAVGSATYVHAHHAGIPFPFAVLAAGAVAIPMGAFIAIPAIRLSGVYLAIATFGFGLLIENIFFPTSLLFGITGQLRAPRPWGATSDVAYYHVVLLIAVLALLVVLAVRASRLGRLLSGLAESPRALAAHGVNTSVIRTLAFCISAFLAGIAGALLGPITGSATSGTFDFGVSLTLLAVLLISGRRPVLAALAGAAIYEVAPAYITSAHTLLYQPVVFGLVAILVATSTVADAGRRWLASPRVAQRESTRTPLQERVRNPLVEVSG